MGQITKEEAIAIADKYAGASAEVSLIENWRGGPIYGLDRPAADCWFFTVISSLTRPYIGGSHILVISKEDGRVLFSGMHGE